ncbi:MAG TPA: EthD domain-containing protein [Acidimicrobiales bacterium]
MVKLVFCVHRHPDLSEEEFHRTWREDHAPLVRSHAETLGIRRYVQSHTAFDPVNAALAASRGGPARFDGVAELWFDSVDTLVACSATPQGIAAAEVLLTDERRFIDHARSPLFMVEEHTVI